MVLCLVFGVIGLVHGQKLGLTVQDSGKFDITLDGSQWLSGSEYMVGGHSASAGDLTPNKPAASQGQDKWGEYSATTIKWSHATKGELMHTSFRTYNHDPSMIVFEQYFPQQIVKDFNTSLSAQTIFPGFDRPAADKDLDCFSYHGVFPKLKSCQLSTYAESHQGGVPLVMYNASDSAVPIKGMLVFSAVNYPKAHHMASNKAFFGAGVKATVTEIPSGWSQLFILSSGQSIQGGMNSWGKRLLAFYGKQKPDLYLDLTHSTIGFWTDNGGYYHYATGANNETYEEVLPRVKAYHDSLGVPFRHWQFDSWFYPKDGGVDPGGGGGAVTNWTAMPSVFPSGMAAIQQKLGVPMVMHNRQWSTHSDYINNEPFPWYISQKAAMAKDPPAFFEWFFTQQQGWGLTMYEQDWMCTEYDEVQALQTNISMADLWLEGMAEGAERSGRSIQYCMPYPNDILSGAQHKAVTNARATGDYFHATDQWAIGATSLYYWALGIIPFKDGFYSSTNKQVGGQTVGPETNPDREALMATLSGAMVGPMDGIHLLNATRTMYSARADGYILKPDAPVATSETCFVKALAPDGPDHCYIFHASSSVPMPTAYSAGYYSYVYSDQASQTILPAMAGIPAEQSSYFLLYNWYSGELSPLGAENTVAPGYEGHIYAVVVPIQNFSGQKWAFIGETNKFVTASTLRFKSAEPTSKGYTVQILGIAQETVHVCVAKESAGVWNKLCKDVSFKTTTTTQIFF